MLDGVLHRKGQLELTAGRRRHDPTSAKDRVVDQPTINADPGIVARFRKGVGVRFLEYALDMTIVIDLEDSVLRDALRRNLAVAQQSLASKGERRGCRCFT